MIHIYLFNEGTRAAVYGVGTYIHQLKECICNNELFSLTVVELSSDQRELTYNDKNGFKEIYIPIGKVHYPNKPVYYRNAWYLLKSYISHQPDDKIIFHLNYYQQFPLLSLMKRDFPECKTLFTIHYQAWCFGLNGNLSQFQRMIEHESSILTEEKEVYDSFQEEKKLYETVDIVICLAEYTQRILTSLYNIHVGKIHLIYNGIKDEYVELTEYHKEKLKSRLHFRKDEMIFLFVGRLDPVKGIDILLPAYKKHLTKRKRCKLILVGDGDFAVYLKEAGDCRNKISFTGRLNKEDVYQFYQIADAGIMLSTHEQCSYVAIEMMMFGVPIIGTTSTGLDEMIEHEVNGWKIPIVEYADSIDIPNELIVEKLRLVSIGKHPLKKEKIRKLFLEKYDVKIMHKKYADLYTNLLS